jgi:uncharacterized damage-inducible protein DinB
MSMPEELPGYCYRGARAMVLLHEREMRRFLEVWRLAKAAKVPLHPVGHPEKPWTDPDYQSLEHLLYHVLRAARGYMTWMCEKLELPDPQIEPAPPPETVEANADRYLAHLLARWRLPLVELSEERASQPSYKSRWDMDYSIDSMLEHALVHPLRHRFQLEELLAAAR